MKELTQEFLKSILHYDPLTGIFTWLPRKEYSIGKYYRSSSWNTKFAGKEAGSHQSEGYIETTINNKSCLLHRVAWIYVYGYLPENDIDHINGNRKDNRICNLREATRSENLQNQTKAKTNNKSTGLLGAFFDSRKNSYYSRIGINYKKIYLGTFNNAQEAHEAYIEAKRKHHEFNQL